MQEQPVDIRKPPSLKRGDLIGLISPASTIADPARINRGVAYLEGLGYRTIPGKHILKVHGYLAGTDAERLEDLHAMFANPEVKAIMCIRGGYGTPRLLSHIDYRLIARNPKIFVGYSDITVLQLAFWKKCRLVSFQGPMVGVDMADPMDGYTEELFWRLLTSRKKAGQVLPADEPVRTLNTGKGTGRLLGGNMALLMSIIGTGYLPSFQDAVLLLEDLGEEPYRVDRMITQLRHASLLGGAKAVLIGQFTDCGPKDPAKPTLTLEELFREASVITAAPFMVNLPFGHEPKKMTMPLGIRVRVDAGKKTVEYLESGVQ
jgi:muramoyltetrapeptide carboxypeptidase